MVVTPSTMLPLGTKAPDFTLQEPLTGKRLSLADVKGEYGLLVVFICNHCPFVIHLQDELAALGRDFKAKGVGMVGISSNDVKKYPADAPDEMANMASTKFNTFQYLFDETQEVAKAYRAACTPDIFLFDRDMTLSYRLVVAICRRGQIDDSRPGNGRPITGKTIREAVDLMVEGKQYPEESMMPSIGCNIKWIKGNEPDYFG
ncbi:alkyl hydroperoxide reductase [Gracilaria domingensis]|nr:alkyl hydroperoxide reductase [Gracilaria domingensis]